MDRLITIKNTVKSHSYKPEVLNVNSTFFFSGLQSCLHKTDKMERISYDFSSSDEDMSSSCSDETANRGNASNKTDKDEESTDKIQNVVYKLVNREVI